MKKLVILLIALVMVINQGNAYAANEGYKEESVYGVLNEDGTSESLYVVNAIHGGNVDYGNYDEVANLTSLDELNQNQDVITLPTYENIFYYQGTLEGYELPWAFSISYMLDGQKVSARELPGATGELTIQISVKKGDLEKASFFEGYALQTSFALSDDLCENVVADGATLVEAGGKKQIAFTVLPGKEAELQVSAKVKDFEMDPVTINAVKMVLGMEVDTSTFVEQISELTVAVGDLDEGAMKLLDGLTSLSNGLKQYKDGMNAYNKGIKEYAVQGVALSSGLEDLSKGLGALKDQNTALKTGIVGIEMGAFAQIDAQLIMMGMTLPALTKDNYRAILGEQEALLPVLTQLEQTLQLTSGLVGYLDGVGQLSNGSSGLSAGISAYVEGASKLAESTKNLYDGAVSLNAGLKDLRDGMLEYQTGTAAFREATGTMESDVDQQINTMLEEFMGKSGEIISFVSPKNKNVSSVQFFFRTNGIEKEAVNEVVSEAPKELTFWERLLKLFGVSSD